MANWNQNMDHWLKTRNLHNNQDQTNQPSYRYQSKSYTTYQWPRIKDPNLTIITSDKGSKFQIPIPPTRDAGKNIPIEYDREWPAPVSIFRCLWQVALLPLAKVKRSVQSPVTSMMANAINCEKVKGKSLTYLFSQRFVVVWISVWLLEVHVTRCRTRAGTQYF